MRFDARRMLSARWPLVAVAAAGLLAAGGAGAVAAADGDDGTPAADPSVATSASPAQAVSLAQAVDTALKAVPGTVEEAELDDEHGRAVWEVGVLPDRGTPRDVVVDAGDGKVTANRADRPDDDDSEPAGAVRGAKITIAHAAGAAEKAVSGRATSTEFEREHGRAVWVADVTGRNGTAYEVTVDAATGGVLSKETDQD
ncbi:PepSY domain-containing protein [Actinomadura madurae]|uniref:PepSY domain-containing protein n=1 Tax=Actinomadura madurae TaxID=1993 RepID=UPI00202605CB|nr:PepSY domain-containing protein [Actinomadura madurae]MCP9955148.1 PepSY domain-containing protein [Actinomadura madurae]MCP9984388.1 PepSY domain-containing protein [Actinomadura madurae]URN00627.1 PepSY domain-containing protein [Actinomadura madurae]